MPSALSEFPAYLWKYCIHCGISATLYSSVDFISMHLFICFLCACAWLCSKIVPVCHMNSSVLDCCTAPCSTQLSHAVVLTWPGLQLQPFLVDLHEQYVKWYVQTKYCVSSCFWKHNCIGKNAVHQSRSVASNHFHFRMFHVWYYLSPSPLPEKET